MPSDGDYAAMSIHWMPDGPEKRRLRRDLDDAIAREQERTAKKWPAYAFKERANNGTTVWLEDGEYKPVGQVPHANALAHAFYDFGQQDRGREVDALNELIRGLRESAEAVAAAKGALDYYWQGADNVPVMSSPAHEADLRQRLYEAADTLSDRLAALTEGESLSDIREQRDRQVQQLEAIARWFMEANPCEVDGRTFQTLMDAGRREYEAHKR